MIDVTKKLKISKKVQKMFFAGLRKTACRTQGKIGWCCVRICIF